ncbi:MAG: peptidoglycan/LPS O-acetylase OafA/YrhL, partial [Candidatus Azotimanducaceae bacterium]
MDRNRVISRWINDRSASFRTSDSSAWQFSFSSPAWRGVAWRGVAWTMLIEILFYAAMFATLPLVKSRPVAASPI